MQLNIPQTIELHEKYDLREELKSRAWLARLLASKADGISWPALQNRIELVAKGLVALTSGCDFDASLLLLGMRKSGVAVDLNSNRDEALLIRAHLGK